MVFLIAAIVLAVTQLRGGTTSTPTDVQPTAARGLPSSTTTQPAASPVMIPASGLEPLLLSREEINAIFGVSALGIQDTYADMGKLNEGGKTTF